ncbi:MAG TPA: heme-binding protein [Acidimicrobiales bacterium]|nr:heme-binding protein [Acidimicrobiales bacterium]
MAELTAPESTSVGSTRLGRDAETTVQQLGSLADLAGTWIGTHGWELIAVPNLPTADFRLILRPYVETITFTATGAPVPNRGGTAGDMFITGLTYALRIADLDTNEPLHLENGMWLDLGPEGQNAITRLAAVPHGDVLLAIGTATEAPGPPNLPELSALPIGLPANAGFGYTDPYITNPPIVTSNVNAVLEQAIQGLNIVQTTTLSVATESGGGILNIPFVNTNAATTKFWCTYWIETIKDETTGDEVMQLQYSQQTNIEFIDNAQDPGTLIVWPHTNVNTLRKQ